MISVSLKTNTFMFIASKKQVYYDSIRPNLSHFTDIVNLFVWTIQLRYNFYLHAFVSLKNLNAI